jgi:hypothetical protein
MAEPQNDGNIRISGRFGEVFIVRRALTMPGTNAPIAGPPVGIKLMEVESIECTQERTFVDVNLPGTGETSSKRAGVTRNGTMTIQHLTTEYDEYVMATQFSERLDDRRRARDLGQRLDGKLVLQIWNDDDAALAAEGWQVEGVDIGRVSVGFSQDDVLTREKPFRFDRLRLIRGFQRIGGQLDPVTGLPAIQYTVGAPR